MKKDRRLDAQNQAELVVQFDRDGPHAVFDPRAFDADVESIPHFTLVVSRQFLSQEGGNMVWLHGVDGCAGKVCVDRLEIRLPPEHHVRGVCAIFTGQCSE